MDTNDAQYLLTHQHIHFSQAFNLNMSLGIWSGSYVLTIFSFFEQIYLWLLSCFDFWE